MTTTTANQPHIRDLPSITVTRTGAWRRVIDLPPAIVGTEGRSI